MSDAPDRPLDLQQPFSDVLSNFESLQKAFNEIATAPAEKWSECAEKRATLAAEFKKVAGNVRAHTARMREQLELLNKLR